MLNASNLHLSYANRTILNDVSLSLLPKERLALVGQNGAGKSTFLKILAGETPDSGKIEKSKNIVIAFLKQVPELDENLSVIETVRLGMKEHLEAIKEHQNLCEDLSANPQASKEIENKIDYLVQYIEHKGGFDTDYLVETILSRLGVSAREQIIKTLSGGERRRVDLARILLMAPDIYLLDEPTNHLDIKAIQFLVEFFTKSNSAVLFVSHDRAFIDEMATKIVELENGKLYTHEPPFANYLENKLIRELIEERSLHRRERLMAGELAWLRAGTPARTTKQNARIERAYELMDQITKDSEAQRKNQLQMSTARIKRLGSTVLELDDVGAQIGERILFRNFNLKVKAGQRYGILGPNGVGKTTLLSILAGRRAPNFGQIKFGKNTEVIEFDQHREILDANATLKETLADHGDYVYLDDQKIHIASYLERYLFSGEDARRKVGQLSGGEQNRLMLAKLFRHSANCLLMDEPTNDLDVSSLAVLEDIIMNYDGVVFVVSHDRSFLDRICTHIIAFETSDSENKESHLEVYNGNYSDYRVQKSREITPEQPIKKAEPKTPRERVRPKKRSFKEERELETISQVIEALEKEQGEIHQALSDSEIFRDAALSAQKIQRLKEVENEIERLYARWQELEEIGQ
ncbi:MAG: ABC-F family ATP-binding cassette domain-containing protein [Myxococcales bacterium]|nr:ABC-F family ATP-binding cassette domain-containing protein [Myxococcales bacterium]USN49791.1 MAG: ABC-F family ATP-binding cassette domain-containing protein [Myxococcales bacterium]